MILQLQFYTFSFRSKMNIECQKFTRRNVSVIVSFTYGKEFLTNLTPRVDKQTGHKDKCLRLCFLLSEPKCTFNIHPTHIVKWWHNKGPNYCCYQERKTDWTYFNQKQKYKPVGNFQKSKTKRVNKVLLIGNYSERQEEIQLGWYCPSSVLQVPGLQEVMSCRHLK